MSTESPPNIPGRSELPRQSPVLTLSLMGDIGEMYIFLTVKT